MRQNRFKLIGIVLAVFFMISCTANIGQVPFAKWTSYQKANFFMKTWLAEKASYDIINQMENKPPELVSSLKTKYKVLEESRLPIRSYVTLVNGGGTDSNAEDEILAWLRQLQMQLVYR
ncbi:MAG TPA: hypothetical protein VMW44_01235 [Candidatus Bathyarchaeia archaeon]|nr:hypothetical protein [Candidatus Bathyarchaeia archaeon]